MSNKALGRIRSIIHEVCYIPSTKVLNTQRDAQVQPYYSEDVISLDKEKLKYKSRLKPVTAALCNNFVGLMNKFFHEDFGIESFLKIGIDHGQKFLKVTHN